MTVPVFEVAAEPSRMWRPARPGRRCRGGAGPGRVACGQPAAVEVDRGGRSGRWWGYCLAHSHGRFVRGGRVVVWHRVPTSTNHRRAAA